MKSKNFDFVLEVSYNRDCDDELNAQLDFLAEKRGGEFVEFEQNLNEHYRVYGFNDQEFADDFLEDANLAISRKFGFEEVTADTLPGRLIWSFDEAVYHHIEFADKVGADRFATMFRATLSTYLEPEMYDIFVLNPPDEKSGYVVIWAFPMASVISDIHVLGDSLDNELDDILKSINTKPKKGELN